MKDERSLLSLMHERLFPNARCTALELVPSKLTLGTWAMPKSVLHRAVPVSRPASNDRYNIDTKGESLTYEWLMTQASRFGPQD